jgi:hypothetical protein
MAVISLLENFRGMPATTLGTPETVIANAPAESQHGSENLPRRFETLMHGSHLAEPRMEVQITILPGSPVLLKLNMSDSQPNFS